MQLYLEKSFTFNIISHFFVTFCDLLPLMKFADEKIKEVNEILSKFVGTHNYHNFTSGKWVVHYTIEEMEWYMKIESQKLELQQFCFVKWSFKS